VKTLDHQFAFKWRFPRNRLATIRRALLASGETSTSRPHNPKPENRNQYISMYVKDTTASTFLMAYEQISLGDFMSRIEKQSILKGEGINM
jgi:hypothetical protein